MPILEYAEWCDYWWENAPEQSKPRVLLVGDSVTRAYRPFVNEYLKQDILADMAASSRALDNPAFLKELLYILKESDRIYQLIHFNNGLHGQHMTTGEFDAHFRLVLDTIREHTEAGIILATCTPVYEESYDNAYNELSIARNQCIMAYAKEHNIPVNDIYHLTYDKADLRLPDGLHFNEQGARLQAGQVAGMIMDYMI